MSPSSGFKKVNEKTSPCILILFLIAITYKTLFPEIICLDDGHSGCKRWQKYKLNFISIALYFDCEEK